MILGLAFTWLMFTIIVGVAANTRGRSGVGWFLLAALISPLIAGLLVLALPWRRDREIFQQRRLDRLNIEKPYSVARRWIARVVLALIITSVGFLALYGQKNGPQANSIRTSSP